MSSTVDKPKPLESPSPDIVLIHPPAVSKRYMPTKFMPYGMAVLTAYLKEQGMRVAQYDFLMEYLFDGDDDINYHSPDRWFSEDEFFQVLEGRRQEGRIAEFVEKYARRIDLNARIYAFSIVAYHQFWAALLLGSWIKRRRPDAIVVFGGPFITIKPTDSFVPYGIADYWIKGGGEIPLTMLHRLHAGGNGGIDPRDIPGIVFADRDELTINEQSFVPAEEERPPDFEGLDLHRYRYDHPLTGDRTLFLPYRISKGCTSRCNFCTGRLVDRYDHKSVDKILLEVEELSEKYHTRTFQFADASINSNPKRLAEMCDRLAERLPKLQWYSYGKINGFTIELLRKVKKAGCFALFWGVESAHQPTVNMLGKKFRVERMFELIDESVRLGIKSYVHLIYNTPHETEQDVRAFKQIVERYIDSPWVVFLPGRFLLEPQSAMFERPDKFGLEAVQKVEQSIFEREQYTYGETEGNDFSAIQARNARHREELDFHLKWIEAANLKDRSDGAVGKYLPSRILARSAMLAGKHPLYSSFHKAALKLIVDRSRKLSEQL